MRVNSLVIHEQKTVPQHKELLVPEFESLGRNDRPAMMREIGEMNGKTYFTSRSCFHHCHPTYLQGVFDETEDETNGQLATVATASTLSSP